MFNTNEKTYRSKNTLKSKNYTNRQNYKVKNQADNPYSSVYNLYLNLKKFYLFVKKKRLTTKS